MNWVLVFLGGGLGALGRYGLTLVLPRMPSGFPWATFCANIIGAAAIGALAGYVLHREGMRAFWVVGVLGGFTTFSAFSLETLQLIQRNETMMALVYVFGAVVMGLVACWMGMRIAGHA